jgi:hypothetical protein
MKTLQDTALCITYILVLNHVLPLSLLDSAFSDPLHSGIPYRTRSNTNTFLAYV